MCRTLITTRNPRVDYGFLRNKERADARTRSDVFTLSARAIGQAVFFRDWEQSSTLFDLALHHAGAFSSSQVQRAVIGLQERFLLLPHSGTGVRDQGDARDLLWALNRAEQLFCQGDFAGAQTLAESIVVRKPAFGWGRLLLVRILFCQEEFQAARSVLLESEMGSIGVTEELAWNMLIPGSAEAQQPSPLLQAVLASRFRIPKYFEALSSLLRGETGIGRERLKTASLSGEPMSFMLDHDPVIRRALQGAAKEESAPAPGMGDLLRLAPE